jgi:hypothetical protein
MKNYYEDYDYDYGYGYEIDESLEDGIRFEKFRNKKKNVTKSKSKGHGSRDTGLVARKLMKEEEHSFFEKNFLASFEVE